MGIKRKIQKDIRQRKIEVVFTNERLITPSGLSIVGGLLRKSELVRLANRMPVKQKRSEPQIKNGDILLSYIGNVIKLRILKHRFTIGASKEALFFCFLLKKDLTIRQFRAA